MSDELNITPFTTLVTTPEIGSDDLPNNVSTSVYMKRVLAKLSMMEKGEKPEFSMGLLEGSPEDILDRMLDLVDDSIDKREGEIIYDALMPTAVELWTQKNLFVQILYQSFAVKASGPFLDIIGFDNGIEREDAIKSIVVVRFKGRKKVVVPSGTKVGSLEHGYVFVTNERVVIGDNGLAYARATCTVGGDDTNVSMGSITLLLDSIQGIETVYNEKDAYNGQDEEDDESLRYRILHKLRDSYNGGTISDFERWARTINGVNHTMVLDKYRGIGTIDIIIGGDVHILDRLVQEVSDLLQTKKLWGLDVLVRPVDLTRIHFDINVTGLSDKDVVEVFNAYSNTLGIGGTYVKSILTTLLINRGAEDVDIITPTDKRIKIDDSSTVLLIPDKQMETYYD